nr:Chain E, TbiA(beta) Thr(-5)Glu Leader [Thermobaculum terrenum ATCC BAA-798]5V1U_F Chain F, TbiA(beta) Thr(-5)Glu Leader [Thermobaculum terrenum ATCC BAA-798]5V1U_G Chain G, TbiA(beta) Thr(-5)Glu Leader [Thermobaculum terrenum ATCC BAA-798]5V1U_H Chain H, TbiA(beta) Thr(-5)Glu Leader [Thermobaculum terrenum ATCC BAA-798]
MTKTYTAPTLVEYGGLERLT